MTNAPKWTILQGDALQILEGFAPGTFDAIITDPPYASGGRTQAEKNKSTARKYSSMGENAPPAFDGDAKDQRSWTRWCAEWLYLARRA
ncbi:MAG: site-specific DNA-methyltransferase, partial [Clostridiales bacterium]|nr:site-specific DNA-methyltransferase [Clostridiales bacterium]